MPRPLLALAALVGLLAPLATAHAVVPGASRVLEAARDGAPPPVAFVLNLVEVRPDGPARQALRVASDAAGRLRVDTQALDTGLTRTTWYGQPASASTLPLESAPLWVLYLAGQPLDDLLRSRSVDTSRTSLAHADDVILWVVGAGPREDTLPQLAVERATGRVRRLVERSGSSENPVVTDVFFEGQQAAEGPAARFPARVRVKVGDAPALTWRVSWLSLDAAPSASEMAPPARTPDPGAP